MRVRYYNSQVEEFIVSLEDVTLSKLFRIIDLLEKKGPAIGMPYSRPLGKGLFEIRDRGKQEARLLYSFYDDNIVILHGFIKKSQKMSQRELKLGLMKLKRFDSK